MPNLLFSGRRDSGEIPSNGEDDRTCIGGIVEFEDSQAVVNVWEGDDDGQISLEICADDHAFLIALNPADVAELASILNAATTGEGIRAWLREQSEIHTAITLKLMREANHG